MLMKIETIWQPETQQRVFRELVEAFSHPGDVRDLEPHVAESNAQRAVLAALMDGEVTLADPHQRISEQDWPLLQARREISEKASYVAASGSQPPDFQPALGSLESPESGAAILLEVEVIGQGQLCLQLSGPGVDGERALHLSGLHEDWLERRAEWVESFPLGVDLLLSDARRIVALPRTTRIRHAPHASER
ncbi:MAG: phosphonate C-P lyase system protein PhnH [Nevskiaceae bacterium]|nr:phosphonate C-P lyase system protein PhnH [Nevskiaceae bacterium]